MDPIANRNEKKRKAFARLSAGAVLAGLVGSNLILSFGLIRAMGSERTVVTPPIVTRSFWQEGGRVSDEYLRQMGAHVVLLSQNVSAESMPYAATQILAFTEPAQHADLRKQFDIQTERLKRLNAAQTFEITSVAVSEPEQAAVFTGLQTTRVGGVVTKAPSVAMFRVTFHDAGSRTWLKALEELKVDPNGKLRIDDPAGAASAAVSAGQKVVQP